MVSATASHLDLLEAETAEHASQHSRPDSNAMEMPSLPSQKVEVLDAPRLRTRGELISSLVLEDFDVTSFDLPVSWFLTPCFSVQLMDWRELMGNHRYACLSR